MNIIILCDQTDCIHNRRYNGQERIGSQGSNVCIAQPGYLPITRDYNPDEPAIRTHCLSKEIEEIQPSLVAGKKATSAARTITEEDIDIRKSEQPESKKSAEKKKYSDSDRQMMDGSH
jgi:hypothetical protein